MQYLSERISSKLADVIYNNANKNVNNKLLKKHEKYMTKGAVNRGINVLITTAVTWGTIIILGNVLGILDLSLTYLISFLLLRYRFGGSHSKNPYICYCLTAAMPLISGMLAANFNMPWQMILLITVFSGISALINRVKDNPRYARKNIEKKKARQDRFFKEGMILLTLITIVEIVLLINGFSNFAEASSLGKLVLFINLYF